MEDDGYMAIPVIDPAPKGDLILVVGEERLKIRVNSLFLKAASKPFAAMLGPNFKEGQLLAKATPEDPMELELPEDCGMAMAYVCFSLHFNTESIPKLMDPERLLDVALVLDKYQILPALKLQARQWCVDEIAAMKDFSPKKLAYLVPASRFLHDEDMFNLVMHRLLLTYNGSYLEIFTDDLRPLVTWELIYALEAERSRAKLELVDILTSDDAISLPQACDSSCRWKDKYLRKLTATVRDLLTQLLTLNVGAIMCFALTLHVKSEHSTSCSATNDLSRFGNEFLSARRDKVTLLRADLRDRIDRMCWWKNPPLRDVNSDDSEDGFDI